MAVIKEALPDAATSERAAGTLIALPAVPHFHCTRFSLRRQGYFSAFLVALAGSLGALAPGEGRRK